MVEDYFSKENVDLIFRELDFFTSGSKLELIPPMGDNPPKKQNIGVTLDSCYTDRKYSDILTIFDGIYKDEKCMDTLKDMSFFYQCMSCTNGDMTRIGYYEDTDFYESHTDIATVSLLCWFNKEPKSFTGGDLVFTDYDIEVPYKHNMLLIFPSFIKHAVTPVKMIKNKKQSSGYGRYCVYRLIYIR